MKLRTLAAAVGLSIMLPAQAGMIGLDVMNPADDAARILTNALVGTGINVLDGSQNFVGFLGDETTGQSATFNMASFTNGSKTVSIDAGIFLTTGLANIPAENTLKDYGRATGSGNDADLTALLNANGAPSTTTSDVNLLEFQFSVLAGLNAISLDFIFGSEEFPDQSVTDVLGIFVDGINYAFFSDNSLVSFNNGVNAANFNDNSQGAFDLEYDGFSNRLNLVGLLNPALTTHTIKIAIADTSDNIYDSGVWLSNMRAITADTGGVTGNAIPAPGSLALMGLGLLALLRRKQQAG